MFREQQRALSVLSDLHIIVQRVDEHRRISYDLYKPFQRSLRQAFEGSGNHRSFGVPSSQPDPKRVSIEELDEYARERWEAILFYMVGNTVGMSTKDLEMDSGTKTLLSIGGFVHGSGGSVSITTEGFSFVLQDTNAQVWSLLIVYLKNAPKVSILSNPTKIRC